MPKKQNKKSKRRTKSKEYFLPLLCILNYGNFFDLLCNGRIEREKNTDVSQHFDAAGVKKDIISLLHRNKKYNWVIAEEKTLPPKVAKS